MCGKNCSTKIWFSLVWNDQSKILSAVTVTANVKRNGSTQQVGMGKGLIREFNGCSHETFYTDVLIFEIVTWVMTS